MIADIDPRGSRCDQSIFIWLDILGFTDAVENDATYDELVELLKRFQRIFNEVKRYNPRIISDGIILQIDPKSPADLEDILKDIGQRQFKFIRENGHFIRGGIAIGTRYLQRGNDNSRADVDLTYIFVSSGLARAVNLEAKHVSWPVVGTDLNNFNKIKEYYRIIDPEESLGLCRGFNTQGEDVFFIDFIQECSSEEKRIYYDILKSKISDESLVPAVKSKYIWLLRYYHHHWGKAEEIERLIGFVL